MPTIGRRVRIAVDWAIALLFPRDITQFSGFEDPRGPFRRAAGSDPTALTPAVAPARRDSLGFAGARRRRLAADRGNA